MMYNILYVVKISLLIKMTGSPLGSLLEGSVEVVLKNVVKAFDVKKVYAEDDVVLVYVAAKDRGVCWWWDVLV